MSKKIDGRDTPEQPEIMLASLWEVALTILGTLLAIALFLVAGFILLAAFG